MTKLSGNAPTPPLGIVYSYHRGIKYFILPLWFLQSCFESEFTHHSCISVHVIERLHVSDFFHLVVGGQVYFADVLRANCEIKLNASY